MVPRTLLHLTTLPMTVNGSWTPSALRELQPTAQGEHVAARTELEAEDPDIASVVLDVEPARIGMRDDLFGLGLNSILVVKLISRLKNDLDVDMRPPRCSWHRDPGARGVPGDLQAGEDIQRGQMMTAGRIIGALMGADGQSNP